MTTEEKIAYSAKKKEYRENMPEYQKQRYLECSRKRYDSLSPENKAELLAKRKANYEKNREKKKAYSLLRYHATKEKKSIDL